MESWCNLFTGLSIGNAVERCWAPRPLDHRAGSHAQLAPLCVAAHSCTGLGSGLCLQHGTPSVLSHSAAWWSCPLWTLSPGAQSLQQSGPGLALAFVTASVCFLALTYVTVLISCPPRKSRAPHLICFGALRQAFYLEGVGKVLVSGRCGENAERLQQVLLDVEEMVSKGIWAKD